MLQTSISSVSNNNSIGLQWISGGSPPPKRGRLPTLMQDYYQKWQNEMIRNNIIGKHAIIPVSGEDIVMEYWQIISLLFIGDTGIRIMLLQDVTLQW